MSGGKEREQRGVWKALVRMLGAARLPWGWVIATFALSMLNSQLQLLFPDYSSQIIGGDVRTRTITNFIVVLVLTAVINIVVTVIQSTASAKVTRNMRRFIWGRETNLPIPLLEDKGSKELISRTTTDTQNVGNIFSDALPGIVSTVYYVAGSVVQVGKYQASLSVTLVILVAAQVALGIVGGRVVFRLDNETQARLARMTEMVSEVMSNIPLVKIYTAEKAERRRGRKYIYDYNKMSFESQTATNAFTFLAQGINAVGMLVVIVYGGSLVSRGAITMGQWIAYFMYVYYLTSDLQMVPYYWVELKGIQGTVRRLTEISGAQEEQLDAGEKIVPMRQDLHVRGVSFAYPEAPDKQVLRDVSFDVPAGSMVALVGENGSGKSTLVGLLERFFKPQSGTISYGSTDSQGTSLSSWRELFGYVQQDMRLMGGTVRDNLTYGLGRDASDDELLSVCTSVGLDRFLSSAPQGLDTPIDDFGDNLSGGQRQKIAIARVLLRDPECLILDEYASNLDMQATAQVEECVERLRGRKTIVAVVHDMAAARKADRIVVLSNGSVEAMGTHEELLATSPTYARLLSASDRG